MINLFKKKKADKVNKVSDVKEKKNEVLKFVLDEEVTNILLCSIMFCSIAAIIYGKGVKDGIVKGAEGTAYLIHAGYLKTTDKFSEAVNKC